LQSKLKLPVSESLDSRRMRLSPKFREGGRRSQGKRAAETETKREGGGGDLKVLGGLCVAIAS
jgi:hypothetical protein